jgi:hypothetical protein
MPCPGWLDSVLSTSKNEMFKKSCPKIIVKMQKFLAVKQLGSWEYKNLPLIGSKFYIHNPLPFQSWGTITRNIACHPSQTYSSLVFARFFLISKITFKVLVRNLTGSTEKWCSLRKIKVKFGTNSGSLETLSLCPRRIHNSWKIKVKLKRFSNPPGILLNHKCFSWFVRTS